MTEARKMAAMACNALEDKKAVDIKVIDIEQVSSLADYFIIASGTNRNQVQAMADNVDEILGKIERIIWNSIPTAAWFYPSAVGIFYSI